MTLFCPKCGSIAETDTVGGIICSNSSCNWSDYIDAMKKTQGGSIHLERVGDIEKKTIGKNPESILRYYFVEYIEKDSELIQANCLHDLIAKILKQEGVFTPFVEKCYRHFTKSSVPELMQFYNHFGSYIIKKISETDNLTVVYEKE